MPGRVEIAGGGIGGLAAGLAFARRGWRVRVHEQDAELRVLGAGIYIWENGLRVLEALGVYDSAIAGALRVTRRERRDADGTLFGLETISGPGRLYVPLRRTLLQALRAKYQQVRRRERPPSAAHRARRATPPSPPARPRPRRRTTCTWHAGAAWLWSCA